MHLPPLIDKIAQRLSPQLNPLCEPIVEHADRSHGTGPCPTVVRGAGVFSPGWYYQPGLKVILAGTKAFSPSLGDAPGIKINL